MYYYIYLNVQIVKSLKVPGNSIESLSWEHTGVRISLAVDSFIYFAHLRQDYHWTFFSSEVLAVAHNKGEDCDWYITFCNTRLKEQITR
jgi:WD repeat-containing protein 35